MSTAFAQLSLPPSPYFLKINFIRLPVLKYHLTGHSLGRWVECDVVLRPPFGNEAVTMLAVGRVASKVTLGCQLPKGIASSAESPCPKSRPFCGTSGIQ